MKVKGKILKVKIGYNPNSSSIGTLLFAFPAAMMTTAVLFNLVASVLMKHKIKKTQEFSETHSN